MNSLTIEIDGLPPSVGHYNAYRVMRARGKDIVSCYPTAEAKAWKQTVSAICAGRRVVSTAYVLGYLVVVPDARRRDLDNFGKCILDALVECGAISDDSRVMEIHAYKRIVKGAPSKTRITITAMQPALPRAEAPKTGRKG